MSPHLQSPPSAQPREQPSKETPFDEHRANDPAYLFQAFHASPDLLFLKDLQGRYRCCNQAFADFVGRRPQDLVGLCDTDLFPRPRAAACRAAELLAIQTGNAHQSEECFCAPDGKQLLVEVRRVPTTTPDGQIDGLFCACRDITPMRDALSRLHTCEANLDALVTAAPDLTFIASADGHLLTSNRLFCAKLAYSLDELIGAEMSSLLAPHGQPHDMNGLLLAAAAGPISRTLHFRTRAGHDLPVEAQLTAGLWSGKRALFCSGRHVSTPRPRDEQPRQLTNIQHMLLQFATELVNLPLDHVDGAIQNALSNVGRMLSADRAYLFTYDPSVGILRKDHEWCADEVPCDRRPPPYRVFPPHLTRSILEHLQSGVIHVPHVASLSRNDALTEWLAQRGIQSMITFPMHVPTGCLGFLGFDTILDEHQWCASEIALLKEFAEILASVRLRVQTEKALLKRSADMEMLLDTMDVHVWYLDNAETYGLVNRAHADFLGYPRESIQHNPFRAFHPPEIAASCLEVNRQVFASANSIRRQEWLMAKSGERRLFEIVKTPSVTSDGKVAYVVCVAHDITEKTRLQEELIRSRDEAERTAKLKALLLADMSHEIRTPLNVILGYLQIMDRECIDCPQKQSLKAMTKSGEHLLDLINDILSVIRYDNRPTLLNETTFDIPQLIEDIKLLFDKPPKNAHVKLETVIGRKVPKYVVTDKSKVRQILMNLAGNAVKFTEQGHVRISLRLDESVVGQTPPPTLPLIIEVQDSGCGIPKDKMDAIFDPFVRLERTSTDQEGTGLGLTLCRRYARAMGGDISVSSEEGRGSVFRYAFHARAVNVTQLAAQAQKPMRVILQGAPPPRILVVDDDPAGRAMQLAMLQMAGFEAVAAESGYEALERIRQDTAYAVILLDQRMPGLDGIETLTRIRALPNTQSIKILILSASGFKEDSDAIQALGGSGVIPKPIKMDQLLLEIGRLTGLSYQPAPDEGETDPSQTSDASNLQIPAGSCLAPELLERFGRALRVGDIQSIRDIAFDLKAGEPQLAATLERLAETFDYEGMADILNRLLHAVPPLHA